MIILTWRLEGFVLSQNLGHGQFWSCGTSGQLPLERVCSPSSISNPNIKTSQSTNFHVLGHLQSASRSQVFETLLKLQNCIKSWIKVWQASTSFQECFCSTLQKAILLEVYINILIIIAFIMKWYYTVFLVQCTFCFPYFSG